MRVKGPRQFGFNVNEWRHVRKFLDIQGASQLRGWSRDGVPTPATLRRLGWAEYLDESEPGRQE